MTSNLLPCATLLLALLIPTVSADPRPLVVADEEPILLLDTLVVSTKVSGPGLWQVRHGDNVLWILGTQSPLPKRFQWESEELHARLAESSLLIAPPGVLATTDMGRLRALTLIPSLLRARRDPDKLPLSDVVGPELYARWQPLKTRHLGRERRVETWRPLFAALRLWDEAIEDARMTGNAQVWRAVSREAHRRKIPISSASVSLRIEDPRSAIRSFSNERLDDLQCFERTLDRLESDLETMLLRAEAWAVGDLETLRSLPFSDQNAACRDALLLASVADSHGFTDLASKISDRWLELAEEALNNHRSSVAVLPIASLLNPESSTLQGLRERGFVVREPGARTEAEAAEAAGDQAPQD